MVLLLFKKKYKNQVRRGSHSTIVRLGYVYIYSQLLYGCSLCYIIKSKTFIIIFHGIVVVLLFAHFDQDTYIDEVLNEGVQCS